MKYIFLLLFFPIKLFSQDITGVWTGTLYNDTTRQNIEYELAISDHKRDLFGYSHTTFIIDNIENIGVKTVSIKRSGNTIFIDDEKLIYDNYPEPPAKGVRMISTMSFNQTGSMMTLSGTWKTNKTKLYHSITGTLSLHKKIDYKKTLIISKLDSLGLLPSLSFVPKISDGFITTWVTYSKDKNSITPTQPASSLSARKIETVQTVFVKNDSLALTIYDNGEVDGDTVSVLLNGKVIIPMLGLSARGYSKIIHLTPEMGDSINIIMYAENLGSIPPNTGLLVLHDGEKVYEIRFTGDLQKNSAIILRRKKKDL